MIGSEDEEIDLVVHHSCMRLSMLELRRWKAVIFLDMNHVWDSLMSSFLDAFRCHSDEIDIQLWTKGSR